MKPEELEAKFNELGKKFDESLAANKEINEKVKGLESDKKELAEKLTKAEASVKELTEKVANTEKQLADNKKEFDTVKAAKEVAEKDLGEAKAELDKIKAEELKKNRISMIEKKVGDAAKAAELFKKFEKLDDSTFASVVEVLSTPKAEVPAEELEAEVPAGAVAEENTSTDFRKELGEYYKKVLNNKETK